MDKIICHLNEFTKNLTNNTINISTLINQNQDKALIIKSNQGVWYYYDKKLLRITNNIFGEHHYLFSILCIPNNKNELFCYMNDGQIIKISYKDNHIIINLQNIMAIHYVQYQWIDPLSVDEIKFLL